MLIKLLIIEDDRDLASTLKTTLETENFEVFVVNSGREGVEATHQFEPDVILLELMMPEMDGWQVCRKIRTFSQTPILVFSPVINPELVDQALDDGADDYLVKPAPYAVLASRLKRLARLAQAIPKPDKVKDMET
jgi:DNA-binding response OmpR family regulator